MDKLLYHYQEELKRLETGTRQLSEQCHNITPVMLSQLAKPELRYLLEAFAFMNAQISKNLEDNFPQLTQNFLECIAPHCLRDLPGFCLLKLTPKPDLDKVVNIAQGTVFETVEAKKRYWVSTPYPVDLLPLQVSNISMRKDPCLGASETVLEIQLETLQPEIRLAQLNLQRISFFIDASSPYAEAWYEAIFAKTTALSIQADGQNYSLPLSQLTAPGFTQAGQLLPYGVATSQLYRILLEYFYYRQLFLSFQIGGLEVLKHTQSNRFTLQLHYDQLSDTLQKSLQPQTFLTSVVPAVNIETQYLDPIIFNYQQFAYPLTYAIDPDKRTYDVMEVVRQDQEGQQEHVVPYHSGAPKNSAMCWKLQSGNQPRLEVSFPTYREDLPLRETLRTKAWLYDHTFATGVIGDQWQASQALLPVVSIDSIAHGAAQSFGARSDTLLHWINHLQFGLSVLQAEDAAERLKAHLLLYVNPKEPWQKKLTQSIQSLVLTKRLMRLPRAVYAVGSVVNADIIIHQDTFVHHSIHLFAQLLESLLSGLVDSGTSVKLTISDQHGNVSYQGKLKYRSQA